MCLFNHNYVQASTGVLFCKDCGKTKEIEICDHSFSKWQVRSTQSNDYGDWKMIQSRRCSKCDFVEFNKQTL